MLSSVRRSYINFATGCKRQFTVNVEMIKLKENDIEHIVLDRFRINT